MISVKMPQKNKFKEAIRVLEICAKDFGVKINISYKSKKGAYSNFYSDKWVLECMGKKFFNEDFILAVADAVQFIANAHQNVKQ